MHDAFKTVCGYPPDDRGAVLIQRLPGLGPTSAEDGSRVFVDKDFAEVSRSGDVYRYIENPYESDLNTEDWQSSLTALGSSVASYRCNKSGYEAGKVSTALSHAAASAQRQVLAADLALVLIHLPGAYSGPQVYIREVLAEHLPLNDPDTGLSAIEFQDSIIGDLQLPPDFTSTALPRFRRCHIARVEGCAGERDLPEGQFVECTFDEFEHSSSTTNAILALSLPLSTRVMLTILKKLFVQSGSGRKEAALYRGLDHRVQQVVPAILDLLRQRAFIVKSKQGSDTIWLPGKAGDVRRRALVMNDSYISRPATTRFPDPAWVVRPFNDN